MRLAIVAPALLLVIGPQAYGQVPPRIQDSIQYLRGLQTESGAYRLKEPAEGEKPEPPSLRATSAALRGIKYFGGDIPNKALTAKFVDSCFDPKTGGFANTPGGEPDVFVTVMGVLAVSALEMPPEKYKGKALAYLSRNAKSFADIRISAAAFEALQAECPAAEAWLAEIRKTQNPDGTFGTGPGKAYATGAAAAAVLRLGGKLKDREAVVQALQAGQRRNGAYGTADSPTDSTLQASYYVMRSLHMLDALPPDPVALETFVEKCRNEDGGYSNAPGEPSDAAATYSAAIILHWLAEDAKE